MAGIEITNVTNALEAVRTVRQVRQYVEGDVSDEGGVKAKDADKSFKIIRTMVDFNGPDTVNFRAENTKTGEVCRVTQQF